MTQKLQYGLLWLINTFYAYLYDIIFLLLKNLPSDSGNTNILNSLQISLN